MAPPLRASLLAAVVALCALAHPLSVNAQFTYGKLSPPTGTFQEGICVSGKSQSPIDIPLKPDVSDLHTKVCTGTRCTKTPQEPACSGPGLGPIVPSLTESTGTVNNTGVYLRVDVPSGTGSVTVGGKTLELLQFHWHRTSEHTFDGQHEAMELHLVMEDTATGSEAVLATLLKEGTATRAPDGSGGVVPDVNMPLFIAQSKAPRTPQTAADVLPTASFNLIELLPRPQTPGVDGRRPYVHYNGSLTTPPCSEAVDWYVFADMLPVEASQVLAWEDIMAKAGNVYGHDARSVQPLNGRTLDYCEYA